MSDNVLGNLGRYELIGELGRGAMGVVYKARDPVLGRLVAIKTMDKETAQEDEMRQRLTREAAAVAKLKHPNIITIHDYGEENGIPFIAMEILEGIDLKQIIRNEIQLYPAEKVGILRQVALGLHHAHKNGVIHRDVKPANIRILKDGTVKIMDFGIARLSSSQMTKVGTVLGSLDYMSPEQVEGKRVDHRCDIFGFGIVAYELVTKSLPFKGENMPSTMNKILNAEPPEIDKKLIEPFPGLDSLIAKCLQKDPNARFKNCVAVVSDLDRVLSAIQPGVAGEERSAKPAPKMTEHQETMILSEDGSDPAMPGDAETIVQSKVWQGRDRFEKIHESIQAVENSAGSASLGQRRFVGRASAIGRVKRAHSAHTGGTGRAQASSSRSLWMVAGAVLLAVVTAIGYFSLRDDTPPDTGVAADVEKFAATQLTLATERESEGQLSAAVAELRKILDVTPNHAVALERVSDLESRIEETFLSHVTNAQRMISDGQLNEAQQELRGALALKPGDEAATTLLASTSNQIDAQTEASSNRERLRALIAKARDELRSGNAERALATLDEAAAIHPTNAEVQSLRAQAQTVRKNDSRVTQAFNAGMTALRAQNYQSAVRQFEQVLRINPNHRQARTNLRRAREELERPRFGTLTINALPFGEAFLDGKSLGTTPVRVERVAAGSHEVLIVKDGYQSFTRSITISEGQTENVVGQLVKN